ncbi:MAG: HEAT repeat domain-containing protein [Planctomycetes bacterium]|nr:HEAT repeat domain-containing protein [Planctomycetota bacterium]
MSLPLLGTLLTSLVTGLAAGAVAAGCAGNVNDTLAEAKRGDPEGVKQAVVDLGLLLRQKEAADRPYDRADEAAVEYLREAAEKSVEAVTRAIAVQSLGQLRRPDWIDLAIGKLDDRSWIVQKEAAEALGRRPDPRASGPLARKLEGELRAEVRLEVLKALTQTGGEEALKALLSAFLDASARYRNMKLAAFDGARQLSGKDFPFEDAKRWRGYYEERFPAPHAAGDGEPKAGASRQDEEKEGKE